MKIPEDLYNKICKVMPIPCIDIIVKDNRNRILLVRRNNEPAKGEWWFPGGRVNFGETRHDAAVRKLKEECGLDALTIKELGTFDVILDIPFDNRPRHAITTLFQICVGNDKKIILDDQSEIAEWNTPKDWLQEDLNPFVSKHLSYMLDKN